jgi:hypothetical protein
MNYGICNPNKHSWEAAFLNQPLPNYLPLSSGGTILLALIFGFSTTLKSNEGGRCVSPLSKELKGGWDLNFKLFTHWEDQGVTFD